MGELDDSDRRQITLAVAGASFAFGLSLPPSKPPARGGDPGAR
jgi:hypothetical protein